MPLSDWHLYSWAFFFFPSREMLPPRMGLLFFTGAIFLSPFIVFFLKIYFSMLATCKSPGTPERLLTVWFVPGLSEQTLCR